MAYGDEEYIGSGGSAAAGPLSAHQRHLLHLAAQARQAQQPRSLSAHQKHVAHQESLANNPAPLPAGVPTALPGFTEYLSGQRDSDLAKGKELAGEFFDTPEMQALIDLRKKNVDGLSAQEQLGLREQGMSGINAQIGTGLRALRGAASANGVRGGATTGAAMPLLMQAGQQRAGLERDIMLRNEDAKRSALDAYESTLTGERAGKLGTTFGYAGLGAGDRSGAMQYLLGSDFLKYANDNLANAQNTPALPAPNTAPLEGAVGSVNNSIRPQNALNPLVIYDNFKKKFGGG